MELVLTMNNAHSYFSVKNLGRKCSLYMAKYRVWEKIVCRYNQVEYLEMGNYFGLFRWA